MSDERSWIARDMVKRFRRDYGLYCWDEYAKFAAQNGIVIRFHNRDDLPDGFHRRRTVFLRSGLPPRVMAMRAWHEISHVVGFPLNWMYWAKRPMGYVVVAKTERRNDDFAALLPLWDVSSYQLAFSPKTLNR